MGKMVLAAALLVAAGTLPAAAADRSCSQAVSEAEQALVFQTNLMVVSSACRDTVYGEFRARNKNAIIAYQKEMIAHFRRAGFRNAQGKFDTLEHQPRERDLAEAGSDADGAGVSAGGGHAKNGKHLGFQRLPRLCGGPYRDVHRHASDMRPLARCSRWAAEPHRAGEPGSGQQRHKKVGVAAV